MTAEFSLDTAAIELSAREVPWDSAVYGSRVISIEKLEVVDTTNAAEDFGSFRKWLDKESVGLVSCRLSHQKLKESMFLEACDFRFIEMVLHPYLPNLHKLKLTPQELVVQTAAPDDLADLMKIAGTAFSNERFHVDPRISSGIGSKRYVQWVHHCLNHPTQKLLKISENNKIIGLFIISEAPTLKRVHWLLTAISPSLHGLGYGKRVWRAMLLFHQKQGFQIISTTIAARNSRVLNLYAYLQFKFNDPEITFHWVRETLAPVLRHD